MCPAYVSWVIGVAVGVGADRDAGIPRLPGHGLHDGAGHCAGEVIVIPRRVRDLPPSHDEPGELLHEDRHVQQLHVARVREATLEPDVVNGMKYLEAVRDVFGAKP